MTLARTAALRPDRRGLAGFERTTAALARATGRPRPHTPLGAELRSSLLLLLAVLGLPLVVVLAIAA